MAPIFGNIFEISSILIDVSIFDFFTINVFGFGAFCLFKIFLVVDVIFILRFDGSTDVSLINDWFSE